MERSDADPARAAPPGDGGLEHDAFAMERLVLFSDAVFAILITLLALDVRLPEHAEGVPLATLILEAWPKLLSYVISFLVVATLWRAHLRRFRYLVAIDSALVIGNALQLLLIGLIPFSTSVLNGHFSALAVTIYAGNIIAVVVAAALTWRHAYGRPALVSPRLTAAVRRADDRRTVVTLVVFGGSIAIAWLDPLWATLSWILLLPANRLLARLEERRHGAAGAR